MEGKSFVAPRRHVYYYKPAGEVWRVGSFRWLAVIRRTARRIYAWCKQRRTPILQDWLGWLARWHVISLSRIGYINASWVPMRVWAGPACRIYPWWFASAILLSLFFSLSLYLSLSLRVSLSPCGSPSSSVDGGACLLFWHGRK